MSPKEQPFQQKRAGQDSAERAGTNEKKKPFGTVQKEGADKPEKPQEKIVFSEKHSLSEYILGKQIGQGAYAIVR